MKRVIGYFNKIQWGILLAMLLANLLTGSFSEPIGAICSFTGVMCVFLVGKGSISNYYWGIVNTALYAYLAFGARLYGDFMLNAFYYFPLQFVGIYIWKKHTDKQGNLQAKEMTKKQLVLLTLISITSIGIYTWILTLLGGNVPFIDATSTVLSVISMILMIKMYAEQWLLWIVVNVVSIIMWIFPLLQGEPGSAAMIIMWSAYLFNAIYGYFNWKKMAKEISVGA